MKKKENCVKFFIFIFIKLQLKELDYLIRAFLCENKDKRDRRK